MAEASIGTTDEAIHDIRVSLRHLRSQIDTFRSVIDPGEGRALDMALREVGRKIGPARDDLVILRTVRDAASRLSLDVENVDSSASRRARDSQQRALGYLRSDEYASVKSRITSMLANPGSERAASRSSRDLILRACRKRWRKLRRSARNIAELATDDQLHSLRIAAKRARYTAEIAIEVTPAARGFVERMAALQTAYGMQHDAAVASAAVAIDSPQVSAYLRGQADAMARDWRLQWVLARRGRWRDWMDSK